jgi:DNA-3-methyladenine glycosylase
MKILTEKFFQRSSFVVAPELVGKYLVREVDGQIIEGMITDLEVYDGPEDQASHASVLKNGQKKKSGGRTRRTEVMFKAGGAWYVYFTYGLHFLLNIVVGLENYPAAILIRATDKVDGPARLTKYFKINKDFNGVLADRESGLWIEDRGVKINPRQIKKSPRIGVDYAGPIWSQKKYRYYLDKKCLKR